MARYCKHTIKKEANHLYAHVHGYLNDEFELDAFDNGGATTRNRYTEFEKLIRDWCSHYIGNREAIRTRFITICTRHRVISARNNFMSTKGNIVMSTLRWSKTNTLFEPSLRKGDSAWFTWASVPHVWSGVWSYWALAKLLPTWRPQSRLLLGTALHTWEDYAENTPGSFSVERLVSNAFQCRVKGWLEQNDHDSMQNFIGDGLAYAVGAWLASRNAVPSWKTIGVAVLAQLAMYAVGCQLQQRNAN